MTLKYNGKYMVESGMHALGEVIDALTGDGSPAQNTGNYWVGSVFVMRAYCWCDGGRPDHDDECPPNFEHYASGFKCEWYKHASRGLLQSSLIDAGEFAAIMASCFRDLAGE